MSLALFISDLHLSEARPEITEAFFHFLTKHATKTRQLYILGDFFDFWVGDDENNGLNKNVAEKLKALNRQGVRCYFIHGNRDFMIGERYARLCHFELLPSVQAIKVGELNIVILHGDTLCTDDVSYQRFRRFSHKKLWQKMFLLIPLSLRIKIGNRIRAKSHTDKNTKADYVMDVNQHAVIETFIRYHADIMIHGHTHKPEVHKFRLNEQKPVERIVLGDWGKLGWYVEISEDYQVALKDFPIP